MLYPSCARTNSVRVSGLERHDMGASLTGRGCMTSIDDKRTMIKHMLPVIGTMVGDDDDTIGIFEQRVGIIRAFHDGFVFEPHLCHVRIMEGDMCAAFFEQADHVECRTFAHIVDV